MAEKLLDALLADLDALRSKRVEQVVAICGDGVLSDGTKCSTSFRSFLKNIPSQILHKFANECLDGSAGRNVNSGLVLQDIVNETGARLGFEVEAGLYRGSTTKVGNDGLWSTGGFAFVIEVKTSDLSVRLENIASYRERLVGAKKISETSSSILIVLGRQDTGDLEAQIRGSRYAWDIRLIGIDALFRLLEVKESLNNPQTVYRINELLKPIEYTRVDALIDVVFSTSSDVAEPTQDPVETPDVLGPPEATPWTQNEPGGSHASPVNFYEDCILKINQRLKRHFIKTGRVTYASSDKEARLVLLN